MTRDTEAGLDLDQTTGISFADIVSNGAGGWADLGFRGAQQDDIATLFQNAGFTPSTDPTDNPNQIGAIEQVETSFDFFVLTDPFDKGFAPNFSCTWLARSTSVPEPESCG